MTPRADDDRQAVERGTTRRLHLRLHAAETDIAFGRFDEVLDVGDLVHERDAIVVAVEDADHVAQEHE